MVTTLESLPPGQKNRQPDQLDLAWLSLARHIDRFETSEFYGDPKDIAELRSIDLALQQVVKKPDKINLEENFQVKEIDKTTGDIKDTKSSLESKNFSTQILTPAKQDLIQPYSHIDVCPFDVWQRLSSVTLKLGTETLFRTNMRIQL